ncbi:hypothetical protein BKA81DRAFT_381349 [Phyllosticta paracitricarpa]
MFGGHGVVWFRASTVLWLVPCGTYGTARPERQGPWSSGSRGCLVWVWVWVWVWVRSWLSVVVLHRVESCCLFCPRAGCVGESMQNAAVTSSLLLPSTLLFRLDWQGGRGEIDEVCDPQRRREACETRCGGRVWRMTSREQPSCVSSSTRNFDVMGIAGRLKQFDAARGSWRLPVPIEGREKGAATVCTWTAHLAKGVGCEGIACGSGPTLIRTFNRR